MDDAASNQAQLHAVISGHVQGVGFRSFVLEQAQRLGLTGWVRNLNTGQVEVLAEGSRADLEVFLRYLGRGPSSAYVKDIRVDWQPATSEFFNFRVSRDI